MNVSNNFNHEREQQLQHGREQLVNNFDMNVINNFNLERELHLQRER